MKKIVTKENIIAGIEKAIKGKKLKGYTKKLQENKDYYIEKVQQILLNNDYKCAKAIHSERYENGKLRKLTFTMDSLDIAVRFTITVFFNKILIPKMHKGVSANIQNRGTLYTINLAKKFIQQDKYQYFLCEDIHKYFENINVEILLKIIKQESQCNDSLLSVCKEMLSLCDKGISIGTYDCQLWANVYLMQFDNFITNRYKNIGYIRYCDNIFIFSNNIKELHKVHKDITNYTKRLKLKLNPCQYGKADKGCRVLSAVIFPTHTRLRRRVKESMRRSNNIASYFGHCKYIDSKNLIRTMVYKKFEDIIDIPEYITTFTGDKRDLDTLVNKKLLVTDCIIEPSKFVGKQGQKKDRAKVSFILNDKNYIFFSSSQPILHYCKYFIQDKQKYLPIEVTIKKENKQYKFAKYVEQD